MSDKNRRTFKILSQKLDSHLSKVLMICCTVILASVLMHDGDHLRQAYNWGYSIRCLWWCLIWLCISFLPFPFF